MLNEASVEWHEEGHLVVCLAEMHTVLIVVFHSPVMSAFCP